MSFMNEYFRAESRGGDRYSIFVFSADYNAFVHECICTIRGNVTERKIALALAAIDERNELD